MQANSKLSWQSRLVAVVLFYEAIFVQVAIQNPFEAKDMGLWEYLLKLTFLHFFDQSPNADSALEKMV